MVPVCVCVWGGDDDGPTPLYWVGGGGFSESCLLGENLNKKKPAMIKCGGGEGNYLEREAYSKISISTF